ncbi:GAD-like domain-containing protein [uncultured Litoreibacter sp.]|uniref:GAD-like domain-containing protein n=1 Tax=uncultured Litoreibacter sp. TaxID=1392394 RepID=UPI0026232B9C|nr:GAD-like domain-containing protein [uncultured Litoreibacter sp.]
MNNSEYIADIFLENGAFEKPQQVSGDTVETYRSKLPELLLDIWKQHGVGGWYNGLYRLCIPNDFEGLLSQVFHADDDFSHNDCNVIAYSAFGNLVVWSERHGLVEISLLRGVLTCDDLLHLEKKTKSSISLTSEFYMLSEKSSLEAHNAYDDADKPLFARARKRLGDLEPGECYGFFPALAMGGAPRLENLKRTKALEHFLFLAQLQQFTLMDYLSRPIRAVRMIG